MAARRRVATIAMGWRVPLAGREQIPEIRVARMSGGVVGGE